MTALLLTFIAVSTIIHIPQLPMGIILNRWYDLFCCYWLFVFLNEKVFNIMFCLFFPKSLCSLFLLCQFSHCTWKDLNTGQVPRQPLTPSKYYARILFITIDHKHNTCWESILAKQLSFSGV